MSRAVGFATSRRRRPARATDLLPSADRRAADWGTIVSTPSYEIFAIKYAEVGRKAWGNFVDGDPHEDSDMPLDYFVWAIVGGGRTIVVDTGFDGTMAKKRGSARSSTRSRKGSRPSASRTRREGRDHHAHAL